MRLLLKRRRRTVLLRVLDLSYNAETIGLDLCPKSSFFCRFVPKMLFFCSIGSIIYDNYWIYVAYRPRSFSRMTGVLIIIPAVIEFFQTVKPFASPVKTSVVRSLKKFSIWFPVIFLPCLGMFGYWLLNDYIDGDPFAYLIHQQHWYQGPMWVADTLMYIVRYFCMQSQSSIGWAVWLPELILFILFFIILAASVKSRENPSSLLVYAFCYLIANYSLSWLLSGGRYLSCGFAFLFFLRFC